AFTGVELTVRYAGRRNILRAVKPLGQVVGVVIVFFHRAFATGRAQRDVDVRQVFGIDRAQPESEVTVDAVVVALVTAPEMVGRELRAFALASIHFEDNTELLEIVLTARTASGFT